MLGINIKCKIGFSFIMSCSSYYNDKFWMLPMSALSTANFPFPSRNPTCHHSEIRKQQQNALTQTCISSNHDNVTQNEGSFKSDMICKPIKHVVVLSSPVDNARALVSSRIYSCADWRLRGMATIVDMVDSYDVKDETAAHAVTLLDRFIAAQLCTHAHQANGVFESTAMHDEAECVAIAVFMLATKFKDTASPCLEDLIHIARHPWRKEQILKCEELILLAVDWDLHVTTGPRNSFIKAHSLQTDINRSLLQSDSASAQHSR